MKRILSTLLTFTILTSVTAQINLIEQIQKNEKKHPNIYAQNNRNNDTLWVCDSVIHYSGVHEKYGKQEVITRNILGNETLSKYTNIFNPPGVNGYSYIDSISYFTDNENIEEKNHSVFYAPSNSWEASQSFYYNSPEVIEEEFYKSYTPSSQEFNGGIKKTYVYNNNKTDSLYLYFLTSINTWHNQSYCKYYYDDLGNDTLQIYYRWKNNSYVDSLKQQRIFHANKLIHSYDLRYDNINASWRNKTHMFYSFNDSGLEDTIIQQSWEVNQNMWRDEAMFLSTYDENDRMISHLAKLYDVSSQQLVNYMLSTNIYENGNQTRIQKFWENNNWVNYDKYFYSYIDDNNKDTTMRMNWNTSLNEWVPDYRHITIFDFRKNANEYYFQDFENNEWQTVVNYSYFWSAFIPDHIITKSISAFKIYPNPANETVNFTSKNSFQKTLHLYTLSGQLIYSKCFDSKEHAMDCSSLVPGLYIYNLTQINKFQVGKLIIQ